MLCALSEINLCRNSISVVSVLVIHHSKTSECYQGHIVVLWKLSVDFRINKHLKTHNEMDHIILVNFESQQVQRHAGLTLWETNGSL